MLRYRIQGEGPPLVLIHGWGVTYAVWDQLAPMLSHHFQLILIDMMGLGHEAETPLERTYYDTAADALERLRESLGIERWSIFSYSLGTVVGATYARKYRERVERAVYLCPIRTRAFIAAAGPLARRIRRIDTRPLTWALTGWRLQALISACAFNLSESPFVIDWTDEVRRQPVETLKRLLLELPRNGRAPYPSCEDAGFPELFVWAQRDFLSRVPLRARPSDIYLPVNHAAPVSAPFSVAAVVLPFLIGHEITPRQRADQPFRMVTFRRWTAKRPRLRLPRLPSAGRRAGGDSATASRRAM
ncbi:MAG TPA: alpha/beta fold hydrolase [Ktedonobacterales bacterium]